LLRLPIYVDVVIDITNKGECLTPTPKEKQNKMSARVAVHIQEELAMPNQSSKNRIEALETIPTRQRKPRVDPEVSKQRLLAKLAPLREEFDNLPLTGKFVDLVHDCFPFNMYQYRYKDNGCSLWYLKTLLKNDLDEKFTFVDKHLHGEMGKGKGSVGKVLKVVINAKLYEYKYFKLVAQEELAARMVGQVETADESSYMDEQDFLEQRLDEQANERALAAEAKKEAQRKAIVEVKAIILSEITQLNKELKKIKATKKALTTQRAACTAKLKQATDRLETQHRKMEKLNTKDE
jgi:hypothetical protein